MKKLAFALAALAALTLLTPADGAAQQGTMGVYFDLDAATWELDSAPYATIEMYIMLVDHDFTSIYGYEFTLEVVGNFLNGERTYNGPGPVPVSGTEGVIVGLGAPMAAAPAQLLATQSIVTLDDQPVLVYLRGAVPNSVPGSTTPALLIEASGIRRVGTSGWDGSAPDVCAAINGPEVVATDRTSLDQVKSLYR